MWVEVGWGGVWVGKTMKLIAEDKRAHECVN